MKDRDVNEMMYAVYVGDASDVVKRISENHCKGNVEASALRRHIAEAMGYKFKRVRRPSGSVRIRIDIADPKSGEERVSNYICSGKWKYVICESYGEAHDFQWYVIDKLNPLMNKDRRPWNHISVKRYGDIFSHLINCPPLSWKQLQNRRSGPGVYVLLHQKLPKEV